jgi:hypothetical protein
VRSFNPSGLQLPAVPGGATWLADAQRVSPPPQPDGSVAITDVDGGFSNVGALSGGADDLVVQQVLLTSPGTYILSWWDRAVDPATGAATAMPTAQYQAAVYDLSWTPVAGFVGAPKASADLTEAGWSPRHALTFTVTTPNVFWVAFGASAPNGGPGSVAIANVQLELATASKAPTAYVDTDASGQATLFSCARSSSEMRAAFVHTCDPDGTCYYDLNTPIVVDTGSMTANGMSLAGKLASGNYNFRHISLALNVVGTGVIDCTNTGSPDCFGSGFLQYQLRDDAGTAGVLGFDGQSRVFDFGTASIEHAKALTAERYLTTPLGMSDQALINQVQALQFRGRPLDGTYHLRIYDNPALRFDKIEDVQVILNYHYWSRIVTSNNSN